MVSEGNDRRDISIQGKTSGEKRDPGSHPAYCRFDRVELAGSFGDLGTYRGHRPGGAEHGLGLRSRHCRRSLYPQHRHQDLTGPIEASKVSTAHAAHAQRRRGGTLI